MYAFGIKLCIKSKLILLSLVALSLHSLYILRIYRVINFVLSKRMYFDIIRHLQKLNNALKMLKLQIKMNSNRARSCATTTQAFGKI